MLRLIGPGPLLTLPLLLLTFALSAAQTRAESEPVAVNPQLVRFQSQFDRAAGFVEVAEGVYAASGPEYANFSVIEGKDGLVVVDTGWFPDSVRPAWNTLAARLDKPVRAIVYTHAHVDHFGGSPAFVAKGADDIEVYAPAGWKERLAYATNHHFFMIMRRALTQMGTILPEGPGGTVGAGVGPSPRAGAEEPGMVPVTVTVQQRQQVRVAGVLLEFIPTPGDIQSHMMVWLPESKVLFAGDILGGTLPYFATPRFEPDRSPQGFIDSLTIAQSLQPDVVVPGHGRLLRGTADVDNVLQANLDVIRYLSDQILRRVAKGQSADEIIQELTIPEPLASHPDLQPHYHRLDWLIRGLTLKTAGFAADVTSLTRLPQKQEDARLFQAIGGTEAVLKLAEQALADDEPRWTASMATRVLALEPENDSAVQLRHKALRAIAGQTLSAGERNYALTTVLEETAGVDWPAILAPRAEKLASRRTSAALLNDMRFRYRAEEAPEKDMTVSVVIEGENGAHLLAATPFALEYRGQLDRPRPGASLTMSRGTLNRLWAGAVSWPDALERKEIRAVGKSAGRLPALIE